MVGIGHNGLGSMSIDLRHKLALITVMAAAMACSPGGGGEAEAGAGRLVVTRSDGAVALLDPEVEEEELVSDGADAGGFPIQPTPSHDGTTLVWTQLVGADASIGVHTSSGVRAIDAPFLPFFYAFSPDGGRVAMLGNDPEGGQVALAMLDLETEVVELIDRGAPYYISWRPDGEALAAHIGLELLTLVDLSGMRTPVPVTAGLYQAPAWAPDGEIVTATLEGGVTAGGGATVALGPTPGELVVVDPGGSEVQTLADVADMVAFQLSPDGDRLAFVEGTLANLSHGPLQVVPLAEGEAVTIDEDPVVAFEWSPQGDRILFLGLDEEVGTVVPHVWDGAEVTEYPGYAPTATYLSEYLPFWNQYSRTLTQWAPDGSAFAYAEAAEGGEGTVWIQPLAGERTGRGEGTFVSWAAAP